MSNYKCKCGNEKDFFIEHNLSQCGLYCGECGKWQKWMNKDEERLFKHKQELADHDKQIRDEVISEMLKQVEFEEKWLSDAWKENGYNYSSRDVDMAFSGIKHKLIQMKGEQNE